MRPDCLAGTEELKYGGIGSAEPEAEDGRILQGSAVVVLRTRLQRER